MMTTTKPEPPRAGLQGESSKPKRVFGRPWRKGESGNPSGKRRGCVSLAARLKRNLTVEDADRIVAKLIALAISGDLAATKLIFERLDSLDIEKRLAELERCLTHQPVNGNGGTDDYGN